MTYELTALPDEPYFEGAGSQQEDQGYLPVSINGLGFIVDRSQQYAQFTRKSINLLNTQQS